METYIDRAAVCTLVVSFAVMFLVMKTIQWIISTHYQKHKVVNGLRRMAEVYTELEAIFNIEGVDRVLLLRGHNSGGIPTPGMPFYTSVVYRADDHNDTRYEEVEVDAAYVKNLVEAYSKSEIRLTTTDMQPCNLREWYTQEKVTHAVIVYLAVINVSFIYLSIASRHTEGFTADEMIQIRSRINHIRKLISRT